MAGEAVITYMDMTDSVRIEAVFSTLKHLTIHRSLGKFWPLDKIALSLEPKNVQSRNSAHMVYVKQRVGDRLEEKEPRDSDL